MRILIDGMDNRALKGKSVMGTNGLLEEMASIKYHWFNGRAIRKKSDRKYNVIVLTYLSSRIDALMQRFDCLSAPIPGVSSSSTHKCGAIYEIYGV